MSTIYFDIHTRTLSERKTASCVRLFPSPIKKERNKKKKETNNEEKEGEEESNERRRSSVVGPEQYKVRRKVFRVQLGRASSQFIFNSGARVFFRPLSVSRFRVFNPLALFRRHSGNTWPRGVFPRRETRRNSEPKRNYSPRLPLHRDAGRFPFLFPFTPSPPRRHRGSRFSVNSHETNTVLLHTFPRPCENYEFFTALFVPLSPRGERVLSRRVSKNFVGIFI